MMEEESIMKRLEELLELNEARFMAYFHQIVENKRQKAWNDRHIKWKSFTVGGHVLLNDRKKFEISKEVVDALIGAFHCCRSQGVGSC